MPTSRKRLSASECKEFRDLLLRRRQIVAGDVSQMADNALKKSAVAASGELSVVPYHMADIGSENFEHEFLLGLIENEEEELRQIDEALKRIADGTYGVCECGKLIPKARLRALPYAKYCIECQRKSEKSQSQ